MGGGKNSKGGPGDGYSDSGIYSSVYERPERAVNSGQNGNSEFETGISMGLNYHRNRSGLGGPMLLSASIATSACSEDSVSAMGSSKSSSKSSKKPESRTMTSPLGVENSATVAASRLHRGSSSRSRSRSPPISLSRSRLGSSARLDQDRSEDTTERARSKQQRPSRSCDNSKFFSGDRDDSAENGSSENGSAEDGQHEKITEMEQVDPQTSPRASPSSSGFNIDKQVRERLLSQGLSTEGSRSTVLQCLSGSNNSNRESSGGSSVTGINSGGSGSGTGTGSSSKPHFSATNQPQSTLQGSQQRSQKSDDGRSENEHFQCYNRKLDELKTHFNGTIEEHEDAIFDLRAGHHEHEEHLVKLYNQNNEQQRQINLMNQLQRNGSLQGEGFKCPDCRQLYASRRYITTHRGNSACRRARGGAIQRGSRGGGGGGEDENGGNIIGVGPCSPP